VAEFEFDKRIASGDLLRQILLDYLRASRVLGWPGADGLTEDDIVNYYPQAIAAGEVPGWHDLEQRFPSLTDDLRVWLSAKGWLDSTPGCARQPMNNQRSLGASFAAPQGDLVMQANGDEPRPGQADADDCRLSRWLVSFASGSGWYPVGEFIALNAAAAIERAIEVFGPGSAHQAEEIPWDAAPLSKTQQSAAQK
jgi:hypothetical protein